MARGGQTFSIWQTYTSIELKFYRFHPDQTRVKYGKDRGDPVAIILDQ